MKPYLDNSRLRYTVSIREAQELAKVGRRTIYNWMDRGKLEFVRTAGGSRRIFLDTLFRDGNVSVEPSSES